jgi:hypothetical protein
MTMSLISTVTVGAGGAASISFTGITGTATDLLVVFSPRCSYGSTAARTMIMQFNSDTGDNYVNRALAGTGSSVSSNSSGTDSIRLGQPAVASADTSNTFGNGAAYISNYSGSTYKSVSVDSVSESNSTAAFQYIQAGLWNNTAAITSIQLSVPSYNLLENSTASLYTITKGSGGASVS